MILAKKIRACGAKKHDFWPFQTPKKIARLRRASKCLFFTTKIAKMQTSLPVLEGSWTELRKPMTFFPEGFFFWRIPLIILYSRVPGWTSKSYPRSLRLKVHHDFWTTCHQFNWWRAHWWRVTGGKITGEGNLSTGDGFENTGVDNRHQFALSQVLARGHCQSEMDVISRRHIPSLCCVRDSDRPHADSWGLVLSHHATLAVI